MWLRSSESSSRARSRAAERILLSEQRKPGEVRNDAGRVRAARAERSRGAAAAPRSRRRRPPGEGGARGGLPAWRRHGWATRPPVPFQQLGRSGATIRTPRKRLGSRRLFFFFRTNTETDYITKALN